MARSDEPHFKPRPAIVTTAPAPFWLPNDCGPSQWISAAGDPEQPDGVTYTFRTTFELRGMMPDTAFLKGWFIADNHVNAIRLNGRQVPVPEHGYDGPFDRYHGFVARNGFVEGVNSLELDVYNGNSSPNVATAMGLRVELEGAFTSDGHSSLPNKRDPKNESARVERGADRAVTVIREARPSNAHAFARQMPRRVAIELFNTGVVGLKEGDADPNWQIVAAAGDPNFKPKQAVVTVVNVVDSNYMANGFRSQWISTAGDMPKLPDKATYTFRTTFELPGLVPGTAVLRGHFIADDILAAIRLNGHPMGVPKHGFGMFGPFLDFEPFTLSDGFVEGLNTLEMDVLNDYSSQGNTSFGDHAPPNPMLLRVELEGTFTSDGHSSP